MNRPHFVAHSVVDFEEGKSRWKEIGVGFRNQDGSITVRLDATPVNGKIVLQEPKERPSE